MITFSILISNQLIAEVMNNRPRILIRPLNMPLEHHIILFFFELRFSKYNNAAAK